MPDVASNGTFGNDASMTGYQNSNKKMTGLVHRHNNSFLLSENYFLASSNATRVSISSN